MKELIFIDGERSDKTLSLRSLFYGEGVFETFRWKSTFPTFWNSHIERMRNGAEILEITFPKPEYIKEVVEKAVLNSKISDAYVKVCLLSQGNSVFYGCSSGSSLLIVVREHQPLTDTVKAHISLFRRNSLSPLVKIKSLNYLENILARREARRLGFDEAVFLNEKEEVTEGAASNIFWLRKETLFTPSLACGLLPGITREAVINYARELGIEVIEGRFSLNDLLSSQAPFFTNSLNGIISISQVDEVKFSSSVQELHSVQNLLLKKLGWI